MSKKKRKYRQLNYYFHKKASAIKASKAASIFSHIRRLGLYCRPFIKIKRMNVLNTKSSTKKPQTKYRPKSFND